MSNPHNETPYTDGRRHIEWPPKNSTTHYSPVDNDKQQYGQPYLPPDTDPRRMSRPQRGEVDIHNQPPPLTPEEQVVLRDCSRESLYYRCLPLCLVSTGATRYLIGKGILKTSPRFGSVPKMAGVVLFSYIIGRLSYVSKCREKIMQLEHSPLADRFRQAKARKQGTGGVDINSPQMMTPDMYPPPNAPPTLRDDRPVMGLDTERPQYKGLDDTQRPTLDREVTLNTKEALDESKYISYDQLRQRNRQLHEQQIQQQQQYQQQLQQTQPKPSSQPKPPTSRPVKTNQYGDIIDE